MKEDMKTVVLLVCILLLSVAAYAQFTFTNIDCPGATNTTARGINNHGEIVGRAGTSPNPPHAVLISNGQCTPLAPTTVLGTHRSEAFKNNDRGDVVGIYFDDDGFFHGFLLSKKGVLTTLDFPGASETYAWGISESGTVVGWWDILDANFDLVAAHGFTWDGGSFTQVDFPGSGDTQVDGINARGDLVGVWDSGPNTAGHGFVESKHGQFINFDVPVAGATYTQLDDINANGQIIGVYVDAAGNEHGFLQAGATFTSLDYPGAGFTSVWGINSAGLIVGNHYDAADASTPAHGFLAVPLKK